MVPFMVVAFVLLNLTYGARSEWIEMPSFNLPRIPHDPALAEQGFIKNR